MYKNANLTINYELGIWLLPFSKVVVEAMERNISGVVI